VKFKFLCLLTDCIFHISKKIRGDILLNCNWIRIMSLFVYVNISDNNTNYLIGITLHTRIILLVVTASQLGKLYLNMWLLISITFIFGFFDVIDQVLQDVSPWAIILCTLLIYKTFQTLNKLKRFRLAYGTTYTKLIAGYLLRLLRTYVPWVRR
jgi:hypothetical protein